MQLRPLSVADADAYYTCARKNLPRLHPWFFWAREEMTLAEIRRELEETASQPPAQRDMPFGFWDGDAFAGSTGLYKIDPLNRLARIGYWIDAAYEGRGLVTAAVHALSQYAFTVLHLNRIEIRCAPANTASRAVPERLGFTNEGVQRQVLALHGGFQDLIMYSLLASELRSA